MLFDRLGLTAVHLKDQRGHLLQIPHRVPAHGLQLCDRQAGVVLLTLPVCAIDDPRFGLWLGRRGIYRVEDPSGTVARVGEGRVIERVRRHRAAPVVLPARLVTAFAASGEWNYVERRFLEATWSNRWVASGNVLASRHFTRRPLVEATDEAKRLLSVLDCIEKLDVIANRILDNDADEFVETESVPAWPSPPPALAKTRAGSTEARLQPARPSTRGPAFAAGTLLRFEDGLIAANASSRDADVVLHEGSSVYLTTSRSVGVRFTEQHKAFLRATKVQKHGAIGVTRVPIVASSAAHLLKHVTAGRAHSAARWQIQWAE